MKYEKENITAIEKYLQNMNAGDRHFYITQDVKIYKMSVGDHVIRILPAIKKGEFFGKEIWAHEAVGMNKDYFLCLDKMKEKETEDCPFCNQAKLLTRKKAPIESIFPFKPRKRILLNIVDLNNVKEGVKLWIAPFTTVNSILIASFDKKTGTIRDITDPNFGHDLYITRDGEGKGTKYTGIQIDQENTPIESSWLDNRYNFDEILVYPSRQAMLDALESMAGVEINEITKPKKAISTEEILSTIEVDDKEEEIDIKEEIAKATSVYRTKYGV